LVSVSGLRRIDLSEHAETISFVALGALVAALLAAAGQPLFTDDTWWHLALGRAYAAHGPWLPADPLLFTSAGPPAPAAWLADAALYFTHSLGGFPALRILHVAAVAGIVSLLWSLLARATGSRLLANAGACLFICIAAYRLVQLRPHLFTIFAALLLYRLLFEGAAPISRARAAGAIALLAIWANVHAAFLLGPVLVTTVLLGLILGEAAKPVAQRNFTSTRIRSLATVLVLGSLATCINPEGFGPHSAYFIAGIDTPSLGRVGDEWLASNLFSLPTVSALPSPVAWTGLWLLLAASGSVVARWLWRVKNEGASALAEFDFAGAGLACLALLASIFAVRFLWLLAFALLFVLAAMAHKGAEPDAMSTRRKWSVALVCLLLVPAFFRAGDWPIVSRAIPTNLQQYAVDYPAEKYHAHAVWFLDDAEINGNLFAEYYLGGFLGFWLAPELRSFVNGSLNVRKEAIDANLPIRQRRGSTSDERFSELLDAQGIDVFMGIRLPRAPSNARPWFHTTAHLEGEEGWVQIFRNLNTSLFLRKNAKNAANLARVEAYYKANGVAFDRDEGFNPGTVAAQSESWAVAHGVVPTYYEELQSLINDQSSQQRAQALVLMASTYSALGLYEEAIAIDRQLLRLNPEAPAVRRRLVWCLLRLNHFDEARREANALAGYAAADALTREVVRVARMTKTTEGSDAIRAAVARLAVFSPAEASRLRASIARPEARAH
jgi:tetratricopeptide (TPR) repeat protein